MAQTAWLGDGLESLVARFPWIDPSIARPGAEPATTDVDLVIIGSGYGAAVAAREFAGSRPADRPDGPPLSICILERGLEYLPGAFPSRMADLPGQIRFSSGNQPKPRGTRTGLFDVRVGDDVMAVVANGVGGGSLINAGVMLRPAPSVMQSAPWPAAIRGSAKATWDNHYDIVCHWLGAADLDGRPNDVSGTSLQALPKTVALSRLGGHAGAGAVPITIALRADTESVAGVPLNRCIECGDCATGCNYGAKISLDVGLLAQACRTEGVRLYTGATVLRIEKLAPGPGWMVVVQHTDEKLRQRQSQPFRLRARRVVLAAGTFGSAEILLRSRRGGLSLSSLLGRRFSTNGDLLASVHGQTDPVNAVADEDIPPAGSTPSAPTDFSSGRHIGPTITGMIDLREKHGFVIQDLAVPGPLRRAFEEAFTTAGTLHALREPDHGGHRETDPDPCAVDPGVIARSLPVAMIGHDGADGRLRLLGVASEALGPRSNSVAEVVLEEDAEGDGALRIDWPTLKNDARWARQHDTLGRFVDQSQVGGRVLPNPMWRLLPASMQEDLGVPNGALLTVHPLGGCPMGDHASEGVVDHLGRVFDATDPAAEPTRVHDGLVVLDGSIVPTSLGVNPALTIAALAHRAAGELRHRDLWDLTPPRPWAERLGERPIYRTMIGRAGEVPARARPTEIELIERMRGKATVAGAERWLELTLYTKPTPLRDLMRPAVPRALEFDGERSALRIFSEEPSRIKDEPGRELTLLDARIDGGLTIFQRERSWAPWRTLRAWGAWLLNRGIRDIVQWATGRGEPRRRGVGWLSAVWSKFTESVALASRAGAARRLAYELRVTSLDPNGAGSKNAADKKLLAELFPAGTEISGYKRLTYERAANPVRQLMDMRLCRFPGVRAGDEPVMSLHLPFLAQQSVPLMRIVRQQDQPTALMDFASFLAYVTRILIDGHLWSFRKPDPPSTRPPKRLPGAILGAPTPVVTEIEVARVDLAAMRATLPGPLLVGAAAARGTDPGKLSGAPGSLEPVHIRLTRYRPASVESNLPPVLLIHGYSASGTTFAHPALNPGLMRCLAVSHLRDVWVLDMRSSCGMPTAADDWCFEDMGYEDIPVAVDHVCRVTGAPQVDIVAHCMGAAMLFMGLLGPDRPVLRGQSMPPSLGRHETLRRALWERDAGPAGGDHPAAATDGPRGRIRRLVISQVGPSLLLTPANIARAYLMRYAKQFFAGGTYEFRPDPKPGLLDQLMDRLFAALPYPASEFSQENPLWPPGASLPWVGTRHRIDALFGRVFSLAHMSAETLEHLDDFFGPFSVETVSQVIYFARYRLITDRHGFNRFVDVNTLRERLVFPMLSLHSPDNGLADVGTREMLEKVIWPNMRNRLLFKRKTLASPTLGHQDSLIGDPDSTKQVFDEIATFLNEV